MRIAKRDGLVSFGLIVMVSLALWVPGKVGRTCADEMPRDVEGFTAPASGEHPRLFFRKADLADLRKKAATPHGQAIVKRLRFLLDGGDGTGFPTELNPNRGKQPDGSGKFNEQSPEGKTYTMFHGAGYGMLYQLTGEKKYADLGRKAVELALEGQRDRDNRYSFRDPTGALRSGPSLGAIAIAYDLNYEGWDDAFRKKVCEAIESYNEGRNLSLEELARGSRHNPGSNHWGPQIGGAALALLAIRNDPGVDNAKIDKLLDTNAKAIVKQMTEGWGDHGWFAEGDGPGAISSDTALVPAIQAWKTAGGKDFITPWPNVQWMTLKWVMLTLPPGGNKLYPKRGGYPHNVWARNGMSGTGAFAQGFGAIDDEYMPALVWLYSHTFREKDAKANEPFDTPGPYPHRAALALINWPFDVQEKNPAEVLPHAVMDTYAGHAMFRNRWQDGDDILVTTQLLDTRGNGTTKGGPVYIWGLGEQYTFSVSLTGKPTHFTGDKTGGVVSVSGASLGVDFSGKAGIEGLVVLAATNIRGNFKGDTTGKIQTQSVTAGDTTFVIATINGCKPPELNTAGAR